MHFVANLYCIVAKVYATNASFSCSVCWAAKLTKPDQEPLNFNSKLQDLVSNIEIDASNTQIERKWRKLEWKNKIEIEKLKPEVTKIETKTKTTNSKPWIKNLKNITKT